jgi:hypothetical protein
MNFRPTRAAMAVVEAVAVMDLSNSVVETQ